MPSGTRPLPGPLSHAVARLLVDALRARELSQSQVAATAGISESQLSRALAGRKVFTLDQLDAVCAAAGEDVVRIITQADAQTRDRNSRSNVTPMPKRRRVETLRHTDLELVDLSTGEVAASTDNTPVDPERDNK